MQLPSTNNLRRRGATLTSQGLKKLNQAKAKVEIEQNFKRYTLEALSEETGLTPNTLSKVFSGSVGVDKRTLECCFDAFNLTLLKDDYLYLKPHQDNKPLAKVELTSSVKLRLNPADAGGRNLAPSPFRGGLGRGFSDLCKRSNLAEIGSMSPAETCCPIEPICDLTTPPQTHKMDRSQDNLEPRPSIPPGGQMPLDSVFYIDRPILESLCYEAIQEDGALVNIRAPKQMGKTSLMTRILAYASSLGDHTVSVSLQLADAEILQNPERFLQWFCARVSKQLDLPNAIANFWDNSLGSKSNATDYFEDVILANLDREAWAAPNRAASPRENRPLVIAIDELNQLFAYPDIASEFLQLLRTWSERAKEDNADINPWHKLRLVTVHSTEILMPPSIDPSLLNTGLVIELPEFTPAQVQDLANRWEQEITAPQTQRLIALLGGHPYRLQLAFYYLQQQTITLEELLENSVSTAAIYADHLEQQWWNLQRYPNLLPSFTEIIRQSSPVDCEAVQASQLHKMGLVHLHGLQASLACELLRPFFRARLRQISS